MEARSSEWMILLIELLLVVVGAMNDLGDIGSLGYYQRELVG